MFSRANATGGTGNLVVATTPSFYCANAGYVAMILHRGAIAGSCLGAVLVCRTTDASGTPTATGFYLFVSSSTSLTRTTFISSAVADSTYWASLPTGGTTMLVGGEATVVRVYGLQPEYLCIPQVLLYMDSDLSSEAAFAETPVGATSRSYLTLGGTEGTLPTAQPGVRLAMQYD
jgi:hypothetical protein